MSKKQDLSTRLREYVSIVEGANYLAKNMPPPHRDKAVHPEYQRGVDQGVSLCIKELYIFFPEIKPKKDKKI